MEATTELIQLAVAAVLLPVAAIIANSILRLDE